MKEQAIEKINLSLSLPRKMVNHLLYLESITKRKKDFYIQEALMRYLEDLSDLYTALQRLEQDEETYTSEEA